MPNLKQLARDVAISVIQKIGTTLIDCQSGRPLGRALILPWRGKIHIIGLATAVRPVFLSQHRLTYWKQELAFTTHPPPDYPHVSQEKDERRAEQIAESAERVEAVELASRVQPRET